MKEERNIITIDEYGNISLPTDIGATAMTEREICELFGVVHLSDRSSIEVYDLETIAALAFRIESFGAAKVRKVLLERITHRLKEKTTVIVSVVADTEPSRRWMA